MSPNICLNMIVKNESKIITRLLKSVIPVIGSYCICDTGSTDNTVEVITSFFDSVGIGGKIVYHDFVDFGTNRTWALNQAKEQIPGADYLLFLDADMVLEIGKDFNKEYLTKDVYSMLQGNDNFQYYNTRIISTKVKVTVVCPTHEYYDISGETSSEKLNKDQLFINDIGDGGSKENKFKRDIALLTKGITEEPNNGRYYFYLANSYYDTSDYHSAIKNYKKRIELGGWVEEIFYSWYRLGFCYQQLNDEPNMVLHWIKAYQALPCRSESLYELIKYYRILGGNSHICNVFYQIAKDIKYPSNCSLFIHKDVYDHALLEEFTIFGYYLQRRDLYREIFQLMKIKHKSKIYNLFNNYKFYQPILKADRVIKFNEPEFTRTILGEEYSFISSTPSIINLDSGYLVNLRFVNYRIHPNGSYPYYKHITSINKKILLSSDFTALGSIELPNVIEDRRYIGTEDIKLFKFNEKIIYTGTGYLKSDNIGIVMGEYDSDIVELEYSGSSGCEKNWVFIPGQTLRMVYKWDPLTIGTISDGVFNVTETKKLPQLFSLARGSTNGFLFNNEIWFLVHFVHQNNNEPRHYYHSLVVFDTSMELLRYTYPFKFTSGEIEYSTGLVVEQNKVIITHSVWDRESYVRIYSKDYIEHLFTDHGNV